MSALLHRQRRLVPQQALAIAAGILEGLHAAHQIGVVHRDVKPPNIFLTAPTTVKVLGFRHRQDQGRQRRDHGARHGGRHAALHVARAGARVRAVDARSDIYATGLMLFEMVSGVGPFDDARDHNELLLAHFGRKAPLLSSVSVVAPELDALVAGMLAKDPRERPPSARHVAETLRALAQRYAHYVAHRGPDRQRAAPRVSEPPTRVEGQRRPSPPPQPATRPDGLAALLVTQSGDTTIVQPALEIATTAAHAAGRTSRSVYPMRQRRHPRCYGPDTLVDPLTKAPTAVPAPAAERTEMLLNAPHVPGSRPLTDPGPDSHGRAARGGGEPHAAAGGPDAFGAASRRRLAASARAPWRWSRRRSCCWWAVGSGCAAPAPLNPRPPRTARPCSLRLRSSNPLRWRRLRRTIRVPRRHRSTLLNLTARKRPHRSSGADKPTASPVTSGKSSRKSRCLDARQHRLVASAIGARGRPLPIGSQPGMPSSGL